MLARKAHRFGAVGGLSDDDDLAVFFEELADALAHDGMVVGEESRG